MGLSATFGQAITTIFNAFGDVITAIEYHSITPGTYDPTTNDETVTDVVVNTRGALVRGVGQEKDNSKPLEDSTRVILSASELGLIPTERDFMVISAVRYEIKRINRIPGNPAPGYIIYVRAP